MNSNPSKPGPKPAIDRSLLVWEQEWYWVFHGLVRGTPASNEIAQDWTPIRPPRLSKITELDKERLASWNAKSRTPEGWVPKDYREQIKGWPAEPNVWKKILTAKTPAEVRDAYRSSPFWLNPARNTRPWVVNLEKYAEEFLKAKKYRYPASSAEKRLLHFARAMAGIEVGIGPARAIDLIRNLEHGRKCKCVNCKNSRWSTLQKAIVDFITRGRLS